MSSKHSTAAAGKTPPPKSLLESVCIFCFKNDKSRNGSRSSARSVANDHDQLHKFFTLVIQYLEESFRSRLSSNDNGRLRGKLPGFPDVPQEMKVSSCKECLQIVESYCDTYLKIKSLELELNGLLEKLGNVFTAKISDDLVSSSRNRREKVEMAKTLEFRKLFQKQYQIWMSELFPKASPEDSSHIVPEPGPRKRGRPKKGSLLPKHENDKLSQKSNSRLPPSSREEEEPENIIVKLSPPEWPAQEEDDESDWITEFNNMPQCSVVCVKIDPDSVSQPDNLSDREEENEEDKGTPGLDNSTNDEIENDSESSEWSADEDEKDEKPRKRVKTSSIEKPVTKKPSKPTARRLECLKCRTSPRPTFSSPRLLQLHQNYLHTNGNFPFRKSVNTGALNLTESSLKLKEVNTSLKRCSECPKKFMLQEELTNHQMLHNDFTCDTCSTSFDFAVDFIRHTISHTTSKNKDLGLLTCNKCPSYSTRLEGELINHHLEIHLDKPIIQAICPICQELFKYQDQVPFIHYLNYHDLTRLDDPQSSGILCPNDDCPAYFLTEDQLKAHLSSIHGVSSNSNAKWEMISSRRRLKLMKYKARGLTHECEFCSQKFRTEGDLKTHIWRRHAEEKLGTDGGQIKLTDTLTIDEFLKEEKYVCKICEKVLTSEDQLERHHHHHGTFNCNFCNISENLATELAEHETVHKIHDNEKVSSGPAGNVNCPRCPFSTRDRLDYIDHHLENHLGIPSDRKRCPICKKPVPLMLNSYKKAKKNWIVAHYMEYHDKSGLERNLECEDCGAHFRVPLQLYNHAREIHGKQTIRECCDCGRIFKNTGLLRAHRKSIHQVDESTFQFFCSFPDCEHRFERQIELDYHESNGHNERDFAGIQICPECGKKLVGSGQMAVHMKTHVSQKKKMEEMGNGKTIANKKRKRVVKKKTQMRHLDPSMWKFICKVCGNKFPTWYKLTKHKLSHTGGGRSP